MFESLRALVPLVSLMAAVSGCATMHTGKHIELAPPTIGRDSITVEKYSVRFDHGDPAIDETMWSEIDEEFLPPDVRARLAANGFRIGVIGAHLPPALEHLLHEAPVATPSVPQLPLEPPSPEAAAQYEPKPVDLLNEPRVHRGLWQTRSGNSGIIITAGEQARIPSIPILVRGDDGRVTGRSYDRVMGALTMKAYSERDGRVRLEMVPEIEFGDLRSRFVTEHGIIKPDYRPETVIFDDLKFEALLTPGQMLILSSRAEMPGTLGHHFLTERRTGEPLEQKLLLLRVAQAPENDSLRAADDIPSADR